MLECLANGNHVFQSSLRDSLVEDHRANDEKNNLKFKHDGTSDKTSGFFAVLLSCAGD